MTDYGCLELEDCHVGMVIIHDSTIDFCGNGGRAAMITAVGVGTEHFPEKNRIEVEWIDDYNPSEEFKSRAEGNSFARHLIATGYSEKRSRLGANHFRPASVFELLARGAEEEP